MTRTWTWMALAGLVMGCGGTTLPTDDDGGTDAASDAVSDGGGGDSGGDAGSCVVSPVDGTACKPGDVSCDKVDGCCAPTYACNPQTNTWQMLLAGCMCATFECGDKTCKGTQLCLSRGSGVDGGETSYECAEYPTACARQWTCDCVTKNVGPSCLQNTPGVCDDSKGPPRLSCMGQ